MAAPRKFASRTCPGRVAALMIVPYPPGIPVLMPGERVDPQGRVDREFPQGRRGLRQAFPGFGREVQNVHPDENGDMWAKVVVERTRPRRRQRRRSHERTEAQAHEIEPTHRDHEPEPRQITSQGDDHARAPQPAPETQASCWYMRSIGSDDAGGRACRIARRRVRRPQHRNGDRCRRCRCARRRSSRTPRSTRC